jgi:D-3-phosphoglycerate dehydrogenase
MGQVARQRSNQMHGLVLDSLLPNIEAEIEAARSEGGCSLAPWTGGTAELATADFVLHVRTHVDAEMIGRLTRCRAIGRFGTGLDTVDLAAARARAIPVVGVPDYATEEVAQHSVMLALAVGRGLGRMSAVPPGEAWSQLPLGPPLGLVGPAGIVGFGPIGRRVAELYTGLGFETLVATRQAIPSPLNRLSISTLDEILLRAEIVSLHTALVPETRHLIDAAALRRMRRDAILVNAGRGALVDSQALLLALREGRIRGAGLDVYETGDDVDWWAAFRAAGLNVVLTPHVAWYSPASVERLREQAVRRTIGAARRANAEEQPKAD